MLSLNGIEMKTSPCGHSLFGVPIASHLCFSSSIRCIFLLCYFCVHSGAWCWMGQKFSGQLDAFVRQAGLPLRRVAEMAGIPHQTIFNWLKGSQPRWHAGLPHDLLRLGSTLGLNDEEIRRLLRLSGCIPAGADLLDGLEVHMNETLRIPKGWFVTGDAPEYYTIGVSPELTYQGCPCITIQGGTAPASFAALAQMIKAEAYRGKRLQFSAAVRCEQVSNRAALFMRISDASGRLLAFDNMRSRPITGSSDWTRYAIILDAAESAEEILFGILLSLEGQVWMADVHLEVVGKDVPTTDIMPEIAPFFPVNLGFEE